MTTPRPATREGQDGTSLFSPVAPGRISELIVEQIRTLIRQGHLRPGDRLPSERDLCRQFAVSRVTVRDALRVLEGAGLVDIRVGARGGAFLKVPNGDRISEGIADMVTMAALDAEEVTEARLVLELGLVQLVCERADPGDFDRLRQICDRGEKVLDGGDYDPQCSADFHVSFARAAHNRALSLLAESLQGPLAASLGLARSAAPGMGRQGAREHRALIEAVERRDVDAARVLISEHLGRTAQRLRTSRSGRGRTAGTAAGAPGGSLP